MAAFGYDAKRGRLLLAKKTLGVETLAGARRHVGAACRRTDALVGEARPLRARVAAIMAKTYP